MNEEKINNSQKKLRILVAPLDWGLGHATRCIPIIHSLLKHNTEVLLAAKGPLKRLLEKEFPALTFLPLDGYNITYSRHRNLFLLNLFTQLPKVFFAIRNERKWLEEIIKAERIDAVISDNRPGLYHTSVPCIYITHQLQIQTGYKITDAYIRSFHYRFIDKFQQCWIPDNEKEESLGGALSHPVLYPKTPCKYLGVLSRFDKKPTPIRYDFLLLLSGPEPQRSILEAKLVEAFDTSTHSFALVRGLPSGGKAITLKNEKADVFDHLPAKALNEMIVQSHTVIARSGYSTVMDLIKLQSKAILIATPGQSEQEYLAAYLDDKGIFSTLDQDEVSADNIHRAAKTTSNHMQVKNTMMQESVITDWLSAIRQPASAM